MPIAYHGRTGRPPVLDPTSPGPIDDHLADEPDEPMNAGAEQVAGFTDLVEVARGGDSVVYRARQVDPDRVVALKVVVVDDPGTRARFEREIEITADLGRQHPNIVAVLGTATTDSGLPCLVMEFAEQGSLDDRLRASGPLPVAEVVQIGRGIADALALAHRHGVVHGDVKPQNVLVRADAYVLTDFGIARLVDSGAAGTERFSYRHASPQVLDGVALQPSDDLWSLGSTLHTLLAGRPPFASDEPGDDTALAYLRRARSAPPRPIERPDVPEELRALLRRCLAKDRADRPPDAAALALDLAALQERLPELTAHLPAANPETNPEPDPEPSSSQPAETPGEAARHTVAVGRRRWQRTATLAATGLAIGAVGGWWGWSRYAAGRPDPPPTPSATAAPKPTPSSSRSASGASTRSTVTSASTAASASSRTSELDPRLHSMITVAEVRDGAIYLEWTDPSAGAAIAVVLEHRPDGTTRALAAAQNGSRSYTVAAPAAGPNCYSVVLTLGHEQGTSPRRCVTVPSST